MVEGCRACHEALLAEFGEGFGFRVWGLGFRVGGLGFRVWGLGFRVLMGFKGSYKTGNHTYRPI